MHVSGWMSPETVFGLVTAAHDRHVIYRLSRFDHKGQALHPHPNSWFLTADMFWRVGGYDETLAGLYGTDVDFRQRCVSAAPVAVLPEPLVRCEHVADASTTAYGRKQPQDAVMWERIAARGADWRPKVLSFPWGEIPL